MCELLGISCRSPATIGLSFGELAQHGGNTGPHGDGWGAAFISGQDALILKEPGCAADSPLAAFVRDSDLRSQLVIAHVRKATWGERTLANSQPFTRELAGRAHVFAHNGHIPAIFDAPLGVFEPIGDTDSEHAFCALLTRLEPLWRAKTTPSPAERLRVVSQFAEELRALGPANFLYSDAELLFVHAHRRPKKDDAEPDRPGLHVLGRECACETSAPLAAVDLGAARTQRVQVVATVPLSDEAWRPLGIGEMLVFSGGERLDI